MEKERLTAITDLPDSPIFQNPFSSRFTDLPESLFFDTKTLNSTGLSDSLGIIDEFTLDWLFLTAK